MKLIGSLFILCASVLACYFYEIDLRKKLKNLIEVRDFIKYIKSQIEYFLSPIDKIVEGYNSSSDICKILVSASPTEASKHLEAKDLNVILSFFSSFGLCVKDEAISLCDYTISELEKSITQNKADYPNKSKAFRAICLFSAICAIILII